MVVSVQFYGGPVNGLADRLDAAKGPEIPQEVLDSGVITRLVEILKTSSPNVQRKAASVLEYITLTEPSMEAIVSVDIESGLKAVFQQEVLIGTSNYIYSYFDLPGHILLLPSEY